MALKAGGLPSDANGRTSSSGYAPGTGVVAMMLGTVSSDASAGGLGMKSAPVVLQLGDGTTPTQTAAVNIANTSPTLTNTSLVAALSPNNTGLPVNTPTIVQKAAAVSTGSVATLAKAFTNNNVAGNSIVVVAGCGNGTAMTVADSAGNTYTQAVTAPNSTTFEAAIFYAVGIAAGANTVTVTNAGTAASMAVEIYEVSGLIAQVAAQPDQSSSGTGTSTTASTSALAASSPNSLAFLGVAVGTAAQAVSVKSGTTWTLDSTQNTTTPAGLFTFGSLSQYLASTTPVIPQATLAGSEPWAAASAIFKPVVVGIQGTVTLAGYNYTNITTQTTTLIKTGAGILHSIIINSHAASATIEMDDALTHTTPKIGTITLPSTVSGAIPISLEYDIEFSTGLSITTGTANADVTVVWK
jgi:hypothetical protein